jgi:hypothetical protein
MLSQVILENFRYGHDISCFYKHFVTISQVTSAYARTFCNHLALLTCPMTFCVAGICLELNTFQTPVSESLYIFWLVYNMIGMVSYVIWFHIGKHNINCNRIQASRGRWRETPTGIIQISSSIPFHDILTQFWLMF